MAYATKKKLADNSIVPLGSNLYGTCSTASATAQKDVAMPDFNVLVSGVTIHVQFTNGNTASNPTLKVGSTSAVAIKRNGSLGGKWENGSVISFTYDGTNWVQNDADESSNTTYTLTKSGNRITLTGSDGSTVSVVDENTEYGLSFSNGILSLVPSGNTPTVTIPDNDTTYTITTSGANLIVTDSDGNTDTISMASVINAFEANLTSKSSLTTSDFIRVVGSDNVSYKQSVSSMKTAMGIDALSIKTDIDISLSTTGSTNFTITTNRSGKKNDIYVVDFILQANQGISSTSEMSLGTVSIAPLSSMGTALVRSNDTRIVGALLISNNGSVYLRLTEPVNENQFLCVSMCGY